MVQLREKLCELEREMEVLRGANETLQMRLERVNMQVAVVVVARKHLHEFISLILNRDLFQGDFDPTKTQVVHFSDNPVDIARRKRAVQLEKLREENEKLRERVAILEASEGKVDLSSPSLFYIPVQIIT